MLLAIEVQGAQSAVRSKRHFTHELRQSILDHFVVLLRDIVNDLRLRCRTKGQHESAKHKRHYSWFLLAFSLLVLMMVKTFNLEQDMTKPDHPAHGAWRYCKLKVGLSGV